VWADCLLAAANDMNLALAFFDKAMTPWYYWQQRELLTQSPPAAGQQPPAPKGGVPPSTVFAVVKDGPGIKLGDIQNPESNKARQALKDNGFRFDKPTSSWSREIDVVSWNQLRCVWPWNALTCESRTREQQ